MESEIFSKIFRFVLGKRGFFVVSVLEHLDQNVQIGRPKHDHRKNRDKKTGSAELAQHETEHQKVDRRSAQQQKVNAVHRELEKLFDRLFHHSTSLSVVLLIALRSRAA